MRNNSVKQQIPLNDLTPIYIYKQKGTSPKYSNGLDTHLLDVMSKNTLLEMQVFI